MSIASNEDIIDLDNKSNIIQPDDPCNIQFTSGTTGRSSTNTNFQNL